ncbi:hypothetical protein [Nibribacter koreensis]|uniref:STAS/SEC14 domain-containing protein n=1 Tax=Nibribacter koreensis TaxID=1084519 RepID=A0ABP8F6A5_9BACT
MIISQNGLITLEYDPATDILSVSLPDIRKFTVSEVERSLAMVVEAVLSYDIKKILLDSSKSIVEVDDAEYRVVIMKFSGDLMKTRLKYLARVGSPIAAQEKRASEVAQEVTRTQTLPVEFQNFMDRVEAHSWLVAKH